WLLARGHRNSFPTRRSSDLSSYRQYTPSFALSTTQSNPEDDVQQSQSSGYSYTFENTLSYAKTFNEVHNFEGLLGVSMERSGMGDRKSTRLNSSHVKISYAV